MKTLMLVLAYATLAMSSTPRDKRSYTHAHAYTVPVSVHTVVRPSNTLPIYEYPESTQIETHAKTVYSVSVPITHTVHLEQPEYSRQVIYHNPPALPSYSYNTVQNPVYTAPQVYTPSVSQVYTPPVSQVYTPSVYSPEVYSSAVYHAPNLHRRVYNVIQNPWPYQRYANSWC